MEPLIRRILSHRHFGWYFVIFVLGLALRWVMLDARPVHHDESLHYMYGRYFFDFPEQNFHKYDPMLHGPVLYNTLRLVYLTFGSSAWAGRALITILGSLFIFVPFLFRKHLHERSLLVLCAALALSPTLTFWSRFLREDMLQIWATTAMLYGVVLARPERKAFFVLIGLAFQWCIKANFFVHLAILFGFLVFEFLWDAIVRRKFDGLLVRAVRSVMQYEGQTIFAFFCGVFVYLYFFTSGYRYSAGILDGLYRKSFMYWINQHNIERIPGPFMFHLYQLSWYEFLFMGAFLLQAVLMYRSAPRVVKIGAAISGILTLLIATAANLHQASRGQSFETMLPWKELNLKSYFDVFGLFPIDVLGCFFLMFHAFWVTVYHLLRNERGTAFFGYFFTATLFTYSYLGEKVPWLAIYPFLTGAVYLVMFFEGYFKERPLLDLAEFPVARVLRWAASLAFVIGAVMLLDDPESLARNVPAELTALQKLLLGALKNTPVLTAGLLAFPVVLLAERLKMLGRVHLAKLALLLFILFNARATWMVNQVNGGKASEFMSQVHTTKELHDFALKVRDEVLTPTSGRKPLIYVTGESTWPLTWYFVDLPEYKFTATSEEQENFDYRFIDRVDENGAKQFPGFKRIDLKLRGWWVPDYNKMTLNSFLMYSLAQVPWSDTGFSWTTVLVKER